MCSICSLLNGERPGSDNSMTTENHATATEPTTPRSSKQTFLVGPHLYFRAVELDDAQTAATWSNSPFPAPVEVVKEQLKDRLKKGMWIEEQNQLLIACRRSDDLPVGSVQVGTEGCRYAMLELCSDHRFPAGHQDELLAEMIDLLLQWLIHERNMMAVEFQAMAGQSAVAAVIADHGGQQAGRLREALLVDGSRIDHLWYQVLHPVWVEKIGEPPTAIERDVEREVRSPARHVPPVPESRRPSDAVICGERLCLRPFRANEWTTVADLTRQETEIVFPEGRWVGNATAFEEGYNRGASAEPPESIRFAIAMLETDEIMGINGLAHVNWVHRTAETMTELFKPGHRSQGYGSEAKHLLLEYGFERLDLHMVFSHVDETNPRSAAALRKQGYRDAGYLAWQAFAPDGLCGGWIFDYLGDEWREARETGRIRE